jgi:hypothetical protein
VSSFPLEIKLVLISYRQTSLALGRPDSLGPDEYHNQEIPGTTGSYETGHSTTSPHVLQIVPCMVSLSRLMRRVSLRLYTVPCTEREAISRTRELDAELGCWLQALPPHFRPAERSTKDFSLKPRRPASYIKKQLAVLMIRTDWELAFPQQGLALTLGLRLLQSSYDHLWQVLDNGRRNRSGYGACSP